MTLTRIRYVLYWFSTLVLAGGIGWWAGQREIALAWERFKPDITVVNKAVPPQHHDVDFKLFWEVWDRLERDYLDGTAINPEKMVYGAISGMTASLGDPYTVFLPPQKQEETRAELAGEFGGVGIQLGFKNGRLAVISPLDGTPADEAGVEAGDIIIHIKDEIKKVDKDADGMSLPDAVDLIRGPKGQTVVLTLIRGWDGKQETAPGNPFEVSLRRDTITVKSVTLELVKVSEPLEDETKQGHVAYVRLSRFGDKTITEWNDAVLEIIKASNAQGVKPLAGVVLDVRNNPGGYLDAAVAVASEFFTDGVVVEQKGKSQSHPYNVSHPGRLTSIPLVVLLNKGSASASEIVAGAIQARGRGTLIGVSSFGKGTVQDAQELSGGAGLHVTTARWLLPNGNWIHDEGLKPDVEVEYDADSSRDKKWDNQMKKAIEVLMESAQ